MGVDIQDAAKGLWYGNDTRAGLLITDGFDHQLFDGLISKPRQIAQELSVMHEVGSKHFGEGERPQGMADVLQQLVLKKRGEGGCSFAHLSRAKPASGTPQSR
jgi:hypothetical protein